MENTPIDPKDLCVGSYVTGQDKEIREVRKVTDRHIWLRLVESDAEGDGYGFNIDGIVPIHITPSWLKMLGVTERALTNCYFNHPDPSQNWVIEIQDGWCLLWDGEWHTRIEYVHHLQAVTWHLYRHWLTLSPETP